VLNDAMHHDHFHKQAQLADHQTHYLDTEVHNVNLIKKAVLAKLGSELVKQNSRVPDREDQNESSDTPPDTIEKRRHSKLL